MHSIRRFLLGLMVIAALLVGAFAATASAAPQARPFDARFIDHACGPGKFCGTGTVTGFGRVITELRSVPPPYRHPGA